MSIDYFCVDIGQEPKDSWNDRVGNWIDIYRGITPSIGDEDLPSDSYIKHPDIPPLIDEGDNKQPYINPSIIESDQGVPRRERPRRRIDDPRNFPPGIQDPRNRDRPSIPDQERGVVIIDFYL